MKKSSFNWKYALMETIIDSIGILLAFSINTFSSHWNKKKVRKEYVSSLLEDLNLNLENLETM